MTSYEERGRSVIQKEWFFQRNGTLHSFIYAKDFPFEIDQRFKLRVSGESEKVGQIVRIHPVEESAAWDIITREFGRRSLRLLDHERINDKDVESNKLTVRNIQNLKEEVASGRSRLIKYSSAYFIDGGSGEVLPQKKALLLRLKKIGVRAENKRYSDAKVRNRIIDGQLEGVYLDPGSASHLVPINHGYLFHEGGTFYGICEISNAPVFLDRSVFPSSHQLVLGMTGFGKSFFVKATMMREKVTRNVSLKIIDPLGEYGSMTTSLGIHSIDLLNQEMNIFETVDFLSIKENVDRTLALLLTLFDLNNEDSGILDTGLTKMYETGEKLDFLKDFVKNKRPDTYNKISPIFEGSLKKFCSGKNPNLTGDLRISLKNVPKKLLPFYMLLSLDLLMRSDEVIPVNLVIDEAHYLLQENVVTSVERYIRHARHGNVSMIFISQSANDFLKNGPSLTIMENCSIHILFRHQIVTEEMIKFYSLDDSLSDFLRAGAGFNGKFSTALFFSPGFRTVLRFRSTREEKERIDGVPKG
ncbi:MAG: DUF87 domain-containing protein [Candidatus Thermoplasmatota archaeon]|jgi:hypothetical protein|nr:DUF87 domain-containing protein [Candidatus Thermoplasmatota archaeon]